MTYGSTDIIETLNLDLLSGVELKPALQGNNVRVLVEEMDGGNYTCHLSPSGEYLNHTAIMVQLDPDNRTVILEKKSPEEGKRGRMETVMREEKEQRRCD